MIAFLAILATLCSPCFALSTQRPFALNVKAQLKPEFRSEFLDVIRSDQKLTLSTEPGSLQFVVGEDEAERNTFYLHEQYVSEDAFIAHSETPHFATWEKFIEANDPFVSVPVVDFFVGTHESEEIPVRSAYCLNVELCIKPEVREEFLDVIRNNQSGSNKEPLCLQYHWGEGTSTPNSFYFHEQYTGDEDGLEGFNAHASAPHFAVWEEFASTKDPFSKPPVVQKYKTLK